MTFLATLSNLGGAINSSIILYAFNWLPKKYDYLIAVLACNILGILWFSFSYRTLKRLQKLPVWKWHLIKQDTINDIAISLEQHQNDHKASFISNND